jgi:hypothetical protein
MALSLLPSAMIVMAAVAGPAQAAAPAVRADELTWMAGCWRQDSPPRQIDETWMAPAGGVLLGMSRTVAAGRTVAHEFMQIRERDGVLSFVASPSGQAEAAFTLLRGGAGELVFENRAHDFPQRVIYRRQGDMLVGRIEGVQNGKALAVDYPMRRVSCP